MSSNKQQNFIEEKFSYYIPCYDVMSNEIFFSEFFTEKIITKPKNLKNSKNRESIKYIIKKKSTESMYSKFLKRTKTKLQKKKTKNNSKEITTESSEKSPRKIPAKNNKNEISTNKSDYNLSENYIKKIKKKKRNNLINKEKELLEEFRLNWKKMKLISGFNENSYLSDNYIQYFSRPLFNKFFNSQNLNLYSFNSTLPLMKSMLNKLYINIHIYYDLDSLMPLSEKNDDNIYAINYIKNAFMNLSQSSRQVSLFYIVDTLIKDSLKIFENFVLNLLDNLDNADDINELFLESDEEIDLKEKEDFKEINEHKNKIYEILISIKKNFSIMKTNNNNRFIFKFFDTEEFLYGNYTLGSYNYIRSKVRQHEGISLLLQNYPLYEISPPLMSYPPIIRISEKEISYENLFKLYIQLFPKNEIIYKLGKVSSLQKNRYIKNQKEKKRTKYLSKYTESSDCDFPLRIKIKTLNNMNSFKQWLNNNYYNNTEIHFPYFNTLKKFSTQKSNNFFKNLFSCFSHNESNNNTQENNDIKSSVISESYEEFMDKYKKNKKAEKEINNKLNPYNFISYYKSEKYNSYYKFLLNNIHFQTLFDLEKDKEINYISQEDEEDFDFREDHPFKSKFLPLFTLSKYPSLFIPIYIRIKIYIIYGCYCIKKLYTQPYLLKDFILLNETIVLDGIQCLISHLPYETRIGFTIKAFDQKLEKKFILGSCQIPLYKDNGLFNSGNIEYQFWPDVKMFPRVVLSKPFSKKIKSKLKNKKFNLNLPILDDNDDKIIKILDECKGYVSTDLDKIIKIKEEENNLKEKKENEKEKFYSSDNDTEEDEEEEDENIDINKQFKDKSLYEKNINDIEILNDFKNNYPSIQIELPKFNQPLIHNVKTCHEYKNFLEIKYGDDQIFDNDFNEIKNLFANSQIDIKRVFDSLSDEYNKYNINIEENKYKEYNTENNPKDIFKYLKQTLPLLIKVLKKDPLENLTQEEIKVILICRDYIATIPSALELFLRSINWFNPFEVLIAHKYLKRWAKLSTEDALSLLDCRFPDTKVRLHAVNILREYPDEIIQNLMLMLCQCLLYENFIINPLADFLIERSLKNPKLIGNYFIWYNKVNMKNPFFEEKLSAYILQFLMLCGNNYLKECFESFRYNYYLELFIHGIKKENENSKIKITKNKKNRLHLYKKSLFNSIFVDF